MIMNILYFVHMQYIIYGTCISELIKEETDHITINHTIIIFYLRRGILQIS